MLGRGSSCVFLGFVFFVLDGFLFSFFSTLYSAVGEKDC
jgi:hypothetical protein